MREADDALVLEARDLRVERDGHTLVAVEEFALAAAETHVLLGPNGSGKSTLLRALNGLEGATGRLRFRDRPVASSSDRLALRRATAAVFQEPFLLATSVLGNAEQGLRLRGVGRAEARRRAQAALELFGVEHLAARSPRGLSGGEAQRVSLARAFAVEPEILFLDEPLASLDPPTRRSLLVDLQHVFAARRTAAVWVTHDREEAHAVADTVTFLLDGRVAQSGSQYDVLDRPAVAEIADFLGVCSWIAGVVARDDAGQLHFTPSRGAPFVCGEGVEGPAVACIHPEDVVLFDRVPASGHTSLRNVLHGTVVSLREAGRLRYVTVACDGLELTALVTQAACDELAARDGAEMWVAFKATAVQVVPRVVHGDGDRGKGAA